MKSTKTRFAKKLKSIKAGDYLKQDRILRVLSAADGLVELLPKIPNPISQITTGSIRKIPWKFEEQTIDVSNFLEDEDEVSGSFVGDKENVRPPVHQNARNSGDLREAKPEISSRFETGSSRAGFGTEFRRPDLNSSSLFDPKLLEAFEIAVGYYRRLSETTRETRAEEEDDDITFPEITECERRAEAGEDCDRKDGIALSAMISECERQAGGENAGKDDNTLVGISCSERRAEAEKKDDNTLPDPLLAEARAKEERIQKDNDNLPGVSESKGRLADEEEIVGNDDNVLPKVMSEVERRTGAKEADEGGKDDDVLPDPLLAFEVRCPPGGEDSVVLYTTTLRGIRKTFDDCNKVRFLLESFRVSYYERDVSMHMEYREELRRITTAEALPVLFVKGRCVGGAHRVLGLHEQGKLKAMFDGVPVAGAERCGRCEGIRFMMCEGCRGSRKVVCKDGTRIECLVCNENGLIVCPACS